MREGTTNAPDASGVRGDDSAEAVVARAVAAPPLRVSVWDLPLRLVHWLLVAAVTTAVATGWLGGAWMTLHAMAGFSIVGLLAFRLAWGFVGSTHARFATFVPTPRAVFAYLRGRWRGLGHNPIGALSVIVMLALLALQVTTGLFSDDEIAYAGPWRTLLDDAAVETVTRLHRRASDWLLWMLGLHIAAIAAYAVFRRDNLVSPMLTGVKRLDATQAAALVPRSPRRGGAIAFVVALLIALAVVAVATGYIGQPAPPAPAAAPAW